MGDQVNFDVRESLSNRTIKCFSLSSRYKRVFVSYNAQTFFFVGGTANADMLASTGKPVLDFIGTTKIFLTLTGLISTVSHGVSLQYPVQLDFGPPVMDQLIKYANIYKIEFFNPQTKLLEGYVTVYIPSIG